MSVRVMSAVWDVDLSPSSKLVLLALADCANDEGKAWPSISTLCRKSSQSERTIQRAIKALEGQGHLTRNEILGKGCKYLIHPVCSKQNQETHYLYKVSSRDTGQYYIGARTCFGAPEADAYYGSGSWVKAALADGADLTKEIIGRFEDRKGLGIAERQAVENCRGDQLCMNRTTPSPDNLSPTGYRGGANATPSQNDAPSESHPTPVNLTGDPRHSDTQSVKEPSLNHQMILSAGEVWNEFAARHGWPAVRKFTSARLAKLKARIAEHGEGGWRDALERAAGSEWLGHDPPPWFGFDFLTKNPENICKLLEGNYDKRFGNDRKSAWID